MIGDININLFDYESNNIIKSFSNAFLKDSMFLFITRPVRVTTHSSTVIDNILQNANSKHFLWNCENGYFRSSSYFEKIIIDRNGKETIFKRKINTSLFLLLKLYYPIATGKRCILKIIQILLIMNSFKT